MLPVAPRSAWVAVALAAASIFCMGGVIFGIAALFPVLYYERALQASSCGEEAETCPARSMGSCCTNQQLTFTLMSSIALFTADGAMLLYGEIADRLGPRTCYGIGCSLAWAGVLLLGLGARADSDAVWYLATVALGGSGPGVFMACLMLGEKYPTLHGVISAVCASMWDASALVFMFFNGIYFSAMDLGQEPGIGLDAIAILWLGITVPLGVFTWKALPTSAEVQQLRGESADTSDTRSLTGAAEDTEGASERGDGSEGVKPSSHGRSRSFLQCFCRLDTLLLLGFMSAMNLKSSLYITTFAEEASLLFPPTTAEALATTFNLAFPIGGFVTSVLASMMLERLGEREDLYMLLVVALALIFGGYNLLPYTAAQLASALLFGPVRTTQWACYFHLLSLPSRYPPQYVGRLLGYGNLVIALAGDVPIWPINSFIANSEWLGDEKWRYICVHGVLELLLLAGLLLPYYLGQTLGKYAPPASHAAGMSSKA